MQNHPSAGNDIVKKKKCRTRFNVLDALGFDATHGNYISLHHCVI